VHFWEIPKTFKNADIWILTKISCTFFHNKKHIKYLQIRILGSKIVFSMVVSITRRYNHILSDIGVYGTSTIPTYKGRDATLKEFEKFTLEHGGYQAHSHSL